MSAASITPDLSVWMPSPDSGTSTSTVAVGHPGDVELRLADAHRLDEDAVEPGGIEQIADFAGGGGEPAERAAAGHGADVDALVQGDGFHADAVAEQGAAGEGAGRVHRDDGDLEPGRAVGERPGARPGWICRRRADR